MAKKDKVLVRKQDGSGSGYIFSHDDAETFLKNNPDYKRESSGQTAQTQRAADEAVAAEAKKGKKAD